MSDIVGLSCMVRGVANGKTFIVQDYKSEDVNNIIDEYLKDNILVPNE